MSRKSGFVFLGGLLVTAVFAGVVQAKSKDPNADFWSETSKTVKSPAFQRLQAVVDPKSQEGKGYAEKVTSRDVENPNLGTNMEKAKGTARDAFELGGELEAIFKKANEARHPHGEKENPSTNVKKDPPVSAAPPKDPPAKDPPAAQINNSEEESKKRAEKAIEDYKNSGKPANEIGGGLKIKEPPPPNVEPDKPAETFSVGAITNFLSNSGVSSSSSHGGSSGGISSGNKGCPVP